MFIGQCARHMCGLRGVAGIWPSKHSLIQLKSNLSDTHLHSPQVFQMCARRQGKNGFRYAGDSHVEEKSVCFV